MKTGGYAVLFTILTAGAAVAGPASGTVTSPKGTISPKQAVGYVVRDQRNARNTQIELLLTEVPVNAAGLHDQLDPHVVAINFDELRDRNYLLLWVSPAGTIGMNGTSTYRIASQSAEVRPGRSLAARAHPKRWSRHSANR